MDHIVMQRNYKAFPLELNLLPAKRKCSDFFSSFQMPAFLQMATLMGSGLTYIPWQPHKPTFFFLDPPILLPWRTSQSDLCSAPNWPSVFPWLSGEGFRFTGH